MKKKLLIISSVLTVVFLTVAVVFFFLMKNTDPEDSKSETRKIDYQAIVNRLDFLKFDNYDHLKEYSEENPMYIRESEDKSLFGIGEVYVEDSPVELFYNLNDNGSIQRFDGYYSIELGNKSSKGVLNAVNTINTLVAKYFGVEEVTHFIYDEKGAPIDSTAEETIKKLYEGSAKYSLSVADENETYWCITAVITDKKQIDIEFFRYYGMDLYDATFANLDLRVAEENGVE